MNNEITTRSPKKDPTQERMPGPTPAGGAYSIAYYQAINGDPTPKSKAKLVEIIEYDKKGNAIRSTLGTIR